MVDVVVMVRRWWWWDEHFGAVWVAELGAAVVGRPVRGVHACLERNPMYSVPGTEYGVCMAIRQSKRGGREGGRRSIGVPSRGTHTTHTRQNKCTRAYTEYTHARKQTRIRALVNPF